MCIPVEVRDATLFLIMFADDTVLFSETEQGLQYMLYCLVQYTSKWKIKVNVENTKIMVFRKGGKLRKKIFARCMTIRLLMLLIIFIT